MAGSAPYDELSFKTRSRIILYQFWDYQITDSAGREVASVCQLRLISVAMESATEVTIAGGSSP